MGDFVYVSAGKIRGALLGEKPRWRDRLKTVVLKPPMVESSFQLGHSLGSRLQAAKNAIENTTGRPEWFMKEKLRDDQWVEFEASMSFARIRDLAIFVEADAVDSASDRNDDRQLVLHGSAAHLIGSGAPVVEDRKLNAVAASILPDEQVSEAACWSLASYFLELFDRSYLDDMGLQDERAEYVYRRIHEAGLERMLPALNWILRKSNPAGPMRGWARVTRVVTRRERQMLVASPLYVERCNPVEVNERGAPIFD